MSHLPPLENLPDPGNRYILEDVIGTGVYAKVYKATDTEASNKTVAIKIQRYENELKVHIQEEYRIYRDFSEHPNLPSFYGVYMKKVDGEPNEIWFVIEYCEGGPIIDLIRGLHVANKRLNEEHIAFILRETTKALLHLHKNHIIHRDVRGNNILLTNEGEIKLCDFGLSRDVKTTLGKRGSCIGSPCWMAPEILSSSSEEHTYGTRSDVWALGITAIELGDGHAPFIDMHPTRIIFQIVRNPPPTLYRPANWTQNYNDFIAECLEKNPDHRPFLVEILEHPFFTELPDNDYFLSQELKMFLNDVGPNISLKKEEISISQDKILKHNQPPEKMFLEDIAAMEKISEERILDEIGYRLSNGESYTFIGDVLLSLNSNDLPLSYSRTFHNKYMFKSRSDNAPHIFCVADSAYQDMLHHEDPQHIVLSGESFSGKTTNFRHLIRHLSILGDGNKGASNRLRSSINIIHAFVNAGTPINPDATKSFTQTQLTFGTTGKLSGAIFWVYLLEKMRVSSTDMNQSNFHIFYYFYDAMEAEEKLKDFSLEPGRIYRYLRIPEKPINSKLNYYRDQPEENVQKFQEFEKSLLELDFQRDQLDIIYNIIAAILLLGDVKFIVGDGDSKVAELENCEIVSKIASLLKVDDKKLQWSLLNYCVVDKGSAERRRHTANEARDARDVLSSTIYSRLTDWIINTINQKLALGRAVFGDLHSITITDLFGFECFPRNNIEQLMINCLNEQMQYQYNQRMFAFEMIDQEEEQVPGTPLHYYDNKPTVDKLMLKPNGLLYILDEVSKSRQGYEFLTDLIYSKKNQFVQRVSSHEFSIAHYIGKVTYDARDISDKNRDFLPPEMVETLRASSEEIIKIMFTNQLSKTGNLTMENMEHDIKSKSSQKSKWGAALVAEKSKSHKLNTLSHGQYSQIHQMRTLSAIFRSTSLEILKGLSIGANTGGTHYVRCIRADLENKPKGFQSELVRQQIKAMAVLDTARAKQRGFSHRISFQEFIRRYKFLAFDFDENVDMTKDNCRLLLIRLKLEGWAIGNSKVFLKYYNEEYLSRLYETQVKKIIKVQAMMRAFLAKRNVATKLKECLQESETKQMKRQPTIEKMSEEEAIIKIQTALRGYLARKQYGPLINANTGKLDTETANFVKHFAKKWRAKTIYQVLLHYRAAKFQDLVNFSQQVHIYNQRLMTGITSTSRCLLIEQINPSEKHPSLLGPVRPPVWKIPFRLDDIPYFDTTYLCDPTQSNCNYVESDEEDWDVPLRRRQTLSSDIVKKKTHEIERYRTYDSLDSEEDDKNEDIAHEPFTRDPNNVPVKRRAPVPPIVNISEPTFSNMKAYSPQPYVRQSVDNIREKFQESNVIIGSKAVIYKKRPAPKTPSETSYNSDFQNYDSRSSTKKRIAPQPYEQKKEWEPKAGPEFSYSLLENRKGFAPQPPKTGINPIKEMQLIAKKNNEETTEDDPPFNFQGMLRKTKYNRASMKRSTEIKISLVPSTPGEHISRPSTPINVIHNDKNRRNVEQRFNINSPNHNNNNYDEDYIETSSNYTNVVYRSKVPERPKSCQSVTGTMELFDRKINENDNYFDNDNENEKDNDNEKGIKFKYDSITERRQLLDNDPLMNYLKEEKGIDEDGNEFIIEPSTSYGKYIKEEIYPGIILEGYLAHV